MTTLVYAPRYAGTEFFSDIGNLIRVKIIVDGQRQKNSIEDFIADIFKRLQ